MLSTLKIKIYNMTHLNNINPMTNGEFFFLNKIKKDLKIVFDIGCRNDSLFTEINCEVHYFEPVTIFLSQLEKNKNLNTSSFFNNFGLSDIDGKFEYYEQFQSFLNRQKTFPNSNSPKIELELKKASDYIKNKNINEIDFIKIDTEGFELNVLNGFENELSKVKIIQFEYGGTFLDAGIKLNDVVEFLKNKNFGKFSYLSPNNLVEITDFQDHYMYCNIVCFNKLNNLLISETN